MKMADYKAVYENVYARHLSLIWAMLCYLIEPDAALVAVLIAVMLDFVSKIMAICVKSGGVLAAVKKGELS
ncbi:MAG: hypothetical protein Q8N36_01400, partial [bacterium]|nr:hypothetical protein [bacterium]